MDATGEDESGGDGERSYAMLVLKTLSSYDPLTLALCLIGVVVIALSLASLMWWAVWHNCSRARHAEYESIGDAIEPAVDIQALPKPTPRFNVYTGSYIGAGAEVHTQFEEL